jgi:UDP-glucose 4-epimerase
LRKQLLWDACKKVAAGTHRFFGTGHELRHWLHIDDAVALIVTAAEVATAPATILNGGSGVGTPNHHVVTELLGAMGAGAPEFVGGGRPGDPPRYVADITRARALGWSPRIDLGRGLAEYVRWFKDQP